MTDEVEGEDVEDIPDFSAPKLKPIRFKIDPDTFYAVPRVGGTLIQNIIDESTSMAGLSNEAKNPSKKTVDRVKSYTGKVVAFLDVVLLPESQQRFAERLRSVDDPIDLPQMYDIYNWLIAQYSKRPTVPLSSSANGHSGTGQNSTVGAPAKE